ncbi:MAG: RDD family protein [Candidatus Bathyarchaeales archaeon]
MTMESSSGFDFAHWLYRLIAYIIDTIIIGIPAYIIYWILSGILWPPEIYWGIPVYYTPWWSWLLWPLILGILQLLYFILMDVNSGGTIGKRVMGLKVQMINGGKVQFGQAFLRNISKIFGLFLLLDWLIGIVTPGPDRRQKYTDRMAGTIVVQVKQAFAAATQPPPPPPPPPPS